MPNGNHRKESVDKIRTNIFNNIKKITEKKLKHAD